MGESYYQFYYRYFTTAERTRGSSKSLTYITRGDGPKNQIVKTAVPARLTISFANYRSVSVLL